MMSGMIFFFFFVANFLPNDPSMDGADADADADDARRCCPD